MGAAPPVSRSSPGRWPWPYTFIVVVLIGLVAWPVGIWAVDLWMTRVLSGIGAGLITLPICGALIWLATRLPGWPSKAEVSKQEAPSAGLSVQLILAGLLAIGGLVLVRWSEFALLGVGVAVIWMWVVLAQGALGRARGRALMFPLGFAGFALPWEAVLEPLDATLQIISARLAMAGLNLVGYPVQLWGAHTIWTEAYYVEVNETCSGVNMLITLSMFTLILGWVGQRRLRPRLALLALTPPLALLANGLRVAVIYLMGHYGGNDLAQGPWHEISAYLIFLPMLALIYAVGGWLARRAARGASLG